MQTNFEKEKLVYQRPLIELVYISVDVITASDDPYMDDGYSDGLTWGTGA